MPEIPFYHQAIAKLASGLTFRIKDSDYSTLVSRNGVALPSESDIDSEVIKLKKEWTANFYSRQRQAEYPSYATQLDEIFHNGIDSWKAVIQVTKDKYPKPE